MSASRSPASPGRLPRRMPAIVLVLLAACAGTLAAQQPPGAPEPPPPAVDRDVDSIDAIVRTLYEVISGPAGTRDWNRFRSLFVPGARLIPAVADTARGGASARVLTVEDYIQFADKYFTSNGFFEREVARRADAFGNIADLWSVYESRHAAEDREPFQRGINSIQLLKDGDRWWVVTIYWDAERPDNPIPAKYLPPAGESPAGAPADTTSR